MSLIVSECNQEATVALHGLYDNISEEKRKKKIIDLLAEILRKKASSKIDERQNTHGSQTKNNG